MIRRQLDHLGRSRRRHCHGSRCGGTVTRQRRCGRGVATVAGGGTYRHIVTTVHGGYVRLHEAVAHRLLLASVIALEYLDDGHHGWSEDDACLTELLQGIVIGRQSGHNGVRGQRFRLVVRRTAAADLNRWITVIGTVWKGQRGEKGGE